MARQGLMVVMALWVALVAEGPASPATFPVRVGPEGRHLVDQEGRPFLIHGDTPWSLTHNLTYDEAVRYMEDRRGRGFNTLMVSVPDAYDPRGRRAAAPTGRGTTPSSTRT